MSLGDDAVADIADDLYDALRSGDPIAPPTDEYDMDISDAYAVQSAFVDRRLADGASVVGHKVGLTNEAIQDQLGVDEPDFGRLLDTMVVEDGVVDTDDLLAPRVEPELGFLLAEDLAAPVSSLDVLRATEAVVPVVEVIDSRVRDWNIGIEDTVADNASSALYATGESTHPVAGRDLSLEAVKLYRNGEVVDSGVGAAVLGHPARAVAWLANTLADVDDSLQAGEIVLSGSMTPAVDVEAGNVVTAEFGASGSVTLTVD
ncbi:2-keto-4-pentenoate hydratase [Halobacterium wangiae]|uniref:2-keto-4-pentenoate hydratase n=1 Tax=Halobacterium wangiae TaxID=2902623 RepID=UPI001E2C7274|nr:fumarylacetoacetate hydrolase family protein [Halobacterium wangiae]